MSKKTQQKHKILESLSILKKSSYFIGVLVMFAGVVAASLPASYVSAQSASVPNGPTKKVIVQYSNVLGANTDNEVEESTSGFVDQVYKFNNIPFGVYEVDSDGEQSLNSNAYVANVFENEYYKPLGDVHLPSIGANPADNTFSDTTGPTVYDGDGYAIAVLDTGVDKNHPALAGKIIAEACFSSTVIEEGVTSLCPGSVSFSEANNSGLDCDPSAYEGCGHGTTVAGAAVMNNANIDFDGDTVDELLGGVAISADVISMQVFSAIDNVSICGIGENPCVRSLISDSLSALDYLIDLDVGKPIVAANMSLGGGNYANATACRASNSAAYDAYFDLFSQLTNIGIAPVLANGNEGDVPGNQNTIGMPACVENTVSVGATNILGDTIASYSNNSAQTKLLAPGGDYDGVNLDTAMWLPEALTAGSIVGASGTSQAAPLVSAAFALLREKHPDATVDQLVDLLQDTGTNVNDARSGYTVGPKKRINIETALSTSTLPSIASFTGPATLVNENVDIELAVTASNVASCRLNNGVGTVNVSGGTVSVPGKENYTLTCTGDFNDVVTATFTATTFNPAPTQPNLGEALSVITDSEARTASISWDASEDPDGVDFYQVYLDGDLVDTTTETSFTFSDLGIGLEYVARVVAVDTLGAVSEASADQSFVLAAVTTPLVPDTGLQAVFQSIGSNMVTSVGALLTTAGALVAGRKFF